MRLSDHQAFRVLLGVVLLVAGVFSVLAFIDTRRVQEKNAEIAAINSSIQKLQSKISKTPDLSEKVHELRRRFDSNLDRVPSEEFQAELLRGIKVQATNSELELTAYAIQEGSAGRGRAEAKLPYSVISISITVQGTFFQIASFINRLEHYPRLLSFQDGSFSVPGSGDKTEHLEFACTVLAYQQKKNPAGFEPTGKIWQSVEIPRRKRIDPRLPDPFALRLKRRRSNLKPGRRGTPLPTGEEKKRIEGFQNRLDELRLHFKSGQDPKRLFKNWEGLMEDLDNCRFETPKYRIRHTHIRHDADVLERPIRQLYGVYLSGRARITIEEMKALNDRGEYGDSLALYVSLLKDFQGMAVPDTILADVTEGGKVFLSVLDRLVHRLCDPKTVIRAVTDLEQALENMPHIPETRRLMAYAGECRRKARSLEEFNNLQIQVSGIIWTPEKTRRVAIVNGRGRLQGESIRIVGRNNKPKEVRLSSVGRSRFVHFLYKGLEIPVKVGKAEAEGAR